YQIGMLDKLGQPILTKVVHTESTWPRQNEDSSYVCLTSALRIHDSTSPFTPEEAIIRDYFDRFLHELERFERFLIADLFSEDELFPYLRYYVRLLNGGLHVRDELLSVFTKYLQTYHFEEAYRLIYCRFSAVELSAVKLNQL